MASSWYDPKPISWVGSSPYKTYGKKYTVARHVQKNSSGPIKPLADFAVTRMNRKVSSQVTMHMAKNFALSQTPRLALTGRVACRAIPVVGWALLAYDVYTVGDALYDWWKSDS